MEDALGVVKGFQLRIYIESEKELQVLGCGWRIVVCQFRDNNVLSSTGRQHRHDEANGFQGIGGCNEINQAQAATAPIGYLKPEPVNPESGGRITGEPVPADVADTAPFA